jgi:hypothetical protein
MSEFEIFYEIEGSDYGDGLLLNKHGDRYSIIAARKSQKAEGTVWMDWAFPQDKDRKPKSKAIPLGVRLGDKTKAIKFAKWLLSNLQGVNKEEDCPF